SAVSRSERVAKRRTSIFGMAAPLARCARALDDAHFYVELAVTALIVEGERRAGLAGGDTGVRALGGGYRDAIDREQQVPRPEPGLLPGTAHVQIGDDDAPWASPSCCASASEISSGTIPIQPRITRPYLMMSCSTPRT